MEIIPELLEFADSLQKSVGNRPIVVFGKSRGGWYCIKVLLAMGFRVSCVSDKTAVTEENYFGVPVLRHNLAHERFPDAVWINSLLDRDNQIAGSRYLYRQFGIKAIEQMPSFLTFFMVNLSQRQVNSTIYYKNWKKYYGRNKNTTFFESPTLSYVLTEKCTLNCDNCGAFVPDIPDPRTFERQKIVSDISTYCEAFDVVHHIALQGGEPFLHKEITRIVSRIAQIPNLMFIDIVTNGTICPDDYTLGELAKYGAAIWISDYGDSSPKSDELVAACERSGVYCDKYTYVEREWFAQLAPDKQNRTELENMEIFSSCVADKYQCCQIMDGKIFRCSFSNFMNRQGYIPNFPSDYADLREISRIDKKSIRNIALRRDPLITCDYCHGNDRPRVSAGVQIKRTKKKKACLDTDKFIHIAK